MMENCFTVIIARVTSNRNRGTVDLAIGTVWLTKVRVDV